MHKRPASRRRARMLAFSAGLLVVLYAGVSGSWGAGGKGLIDTVGGTLAREGRARTAGVLAVLWTTVLLKLAASVIGLIAVTQPPRLSPRYILVRRAAWVSAVVLVLYGGVLTLVGSSSPPATRSGPLGLPWRVMVDAPSCRDRSP